MVIAIDGPAGAGKSSTAKAVAAQLGVLHLDTGAMYRAVTLKSLRRGVMADDETALDELVAHTVIRFSGSPPDTRVWLDDEDVSEAVRSDEVTAQVSDYCRPMGVRRALVAQQRRIGQSADCVCEGRDIGTVVFPNAELKFFMVASVQERARRRQRDFEALGVHKSIEDLEREIEARDHKDSTRENSPLLKAADAIELDTTHLTLEQQVTMIVERAQQILSNRCG